MGKLILAAVLSLSASGVYAAMVATPQLIAEPERAELIVNMAKREHVEQQLIRLGVDRADAIERVKQMTDQQIASLQGQLTELPAGAAGVSTTNLLLIIILVILIL